MKRFGYAISSVDDQKQVISDCQTYVDQPAVNIFKSTVPFDWLKSTWHS